MPSIMKNQKISTIQRGWLIVLSSVILVTVLCIVIYFINKDIRVFSSLLLYPFYKIVDYYFGKSKPPED